MKEENTGRVVLKGEMIQRIFVLCCNRFISVVGNLKIVFQFSARFNKHKVKISNVINR